MPLADRFPEYVAELHEISDSHRLPHGKPEDLSRLLEAFQSSDNFATDFGCLMRSIVLREHFRASETELLTLVAVAWAGAEPEGSTPQFSHLIQELRSVLNKVLAQRVLAHRTDGPVATSTEGSKEVVDVPPGSPDTTGKLEEISPDGQMYRQLPNNGVNHEKRYRAALDSVSVQRDAPALNGEPDSSVEAPWRPTFSSPNSPFYEASRTGLIAGEDKKKSLEYPISDGSGIDGEDHPTRRLEPNAAEVLAMGLTGLVVALLLSAGSLPVYRARVSVYVPSTIAGTTNPGAHAAGLSPGGLGSGSRAVSLLNGELTEEVAERMLALPHAKPILRQDVLSRGMRDLHLGGNETILYADLVAETARQVKVTHLQPQNLYAVTCDSWNSQFAAAFCNELADSLEDQPSGATSSQDGSELARTIDAALRPGNQVYPHWYLQGAAGLAAGCLIGILVGFVKRPALRPIQESDLGT